MILCGESNILLTMTHLKILLELFNDRVNIPVNVSVHLIIEQYMSDLIEKLYELLHNKNTILITTYNLRLFSES